MPNNLVICPICGEGDAECRVEGDGQIIHCENLRCASNGGTNASKLLASITPQTARAGNRPIEPSPDRDIAEELGRLSAEQMDEPEMCGACSANLRMDAMKLAVDSFHDTPTTQKLLDRAESIFCWCLDVD